MLESIDDIPNMTSLIETEIQKNNKRGFKSNSRVYRKVFNRIDGESKSIDKFGDNYFCSKKEDETIPVCITLPRSLVVKVDEYCDKKKLTRSRLIRKVLVYALNLEPE